jgi:hypothetical protein
MNENEEWQKGFMAGLKYTKTQLIAVEQHLEDYIKAKEDRLE